MDWFEPQANEALTQIRALNRAMKNGGKVLLRSAGLTPWYTSTFEEEGFVARRVGARFPGSCIDRYVLIYLFFLDFLFDCLDGRVWMEGCEQRREDLRGGWKS